MAKIWMRKSVAQTSDKSTNSSPLSFLLNKRTWTWKTSQNSTTASPVKCSSRSSACSRNVCLAPSLSSLRSVTLGKKKWKRISSCSLRMVRLACRLMLTRLQQRRKICVYLHWKLFPIQKCSTTFSPRNKSLSLSPISHLPNSAAISPRSRCWRPQISRSRPKCKHRALVTRP